MATKNFYRETNIAEEETNYIGCKPSSLYRVYGQGYGSLQEVSEYISIKDTKIEFE